MISILDASAMIALLAGEPGGDVVKALLDNPEGLCYAHSINLCEVYYAYFRAGGQTIADQVIQDL